MNKKVLTDEYLKKCGYVFQYNFEEVTNKKFRDFVQDENARLFVDPDFAKGNKDYTEVIAVYYQENIYSNVAWIFDADSADVNKLIDDIVSWKYEARGCSEMF